MRMPGLLSESLYCMRELRIDQMLADGNAHMTRAYPANIVESGQQAFMVAAAFTVIVNQEPARLGQLHRVPALLNKRQSQLAFKSGDLAAGAGSPRRWTEAGAKTRLRQRRMFFALYVQRCQGHGRGRRWTPAHTVAALQARHRSRLIECLRARHHRPPPAGGRRWRPVALRPPADPSSRCRKKGDQAERSALS